jgi:hypothetical protein
MKSGMNTPLPALAWPLGLAGLLPFLGGLAAMWLWPGWGGHALAAYGAAILSFLGAVHWGLALAAPDVAARARLIGGVIPSLVAWVALLMPLPVGLTILALGLLGLAMVETLAAGRGLLPRAYIPLRWVLTGVASATLIAGASIN